MTYHFLHRAVQATLFGCAFLFGGFLGALVFFFTTTSAFALLSSFDFLGISSTAEAAVAENGAEKLDRARRLFDSGRSREAVALLRESVRNSSAGAEAYALLGDAHASVGDVKAAAASYRRAKLLEPHKFTAGVKLGDAYMQLGDIREALASYRAVLGGGDQSARLHNSLGVAQHAAKEHVGAKASYQQAISADPKFAAAYNNLAIAYAEDGEFEAAKASFKQALLLEPEMLEVWRNYALAEVSSASTRQCQPLLNQKIIEEKLVPKSGRAVAVSGNRRYELNNENGVLSVSFGS